MVCPHARNEYKGLLKPQTPGVPHVNTQDDVWNGYYIPKGSLINCNIGFVIDDARFVGTY